MLWCQGAQNIGLSKHKLKPALTHTVWSQCTPVPDTQTDKWTNIWQIQGESFEDHMVSTEHEPIVGSGSRAAGQGDSAPEAEQLFALSQTGDSASLFWNLCFGKQQISSNIWGPSPGFACIHDDRQLCCFQSTVLTLVMRPVSWSVELSVTFVPNQCD